jgi:2-dehydro-3-deoxygluconokinase
LKAATDAGVEVAFDTNYRARLWPGPETARPAIEAVIAVSRYLSLSAADVAAFGGGDAEAFARGWSAKGLEVVLRHDDHSIEVLTEPDTEGFAPERTVPVVDTTGAGDSFNAGYLAARLKGNGIGEAVREARRLAAVVVQHPGAIIPKSAMPDVA